MGLQVKRCDAGDSKLRLRVDERIGWVPCVCSYASTHGGAQVIVDTQEHGRFSVTLPHPDLEFAS